MNNDLDFLTKKYWTRFVAVSLLNASVFTVYRLYVNHLKKKKEKKETKENNTPTTFIPIKEMKNDIPPPVKQEIKKSIKNSVSSKKINTVSNDVVKLKVGRPKKNSLPPIKHTQKK